ncbi:hypothetical protein, partial [Parasphingorhabdus sp.]|uniref:hypothetical protein n=1 Tax=Parasphingorhabdus sp. TaxID=2709688 RepID=UPI0030AC3299
MTKWKGRVASVAPFLGLVTSSVSPGVLNISGLASGTSLTAVAAVMASVGGLLFSPMASAETLSGANTTTITKTGNPLVVETDDSFGIVTTSGPALDLRGTNGTTFTDNFNSTITGGTYGIFARNYGTDALSVTSTGAVTGTSGDGIRAFNDTPGTDLTVSAAAVSGGKYGILANNAGTGALSVTATGDVSGTSEKGIYARNYNTNGTDLTVSAAAVSGGEYGIKAFNFGT